MPVVAHHHKKKRHIDGGGGDGSDFEDLLDNLSSCKVSLRINRNGRADIETQPAHRRDVVMVLTVAWGAVLATPMLALAEEVTTVAEQAVLPAVEEVVLLVLEEVTAIVEEKMIPTPVATVAVEVATAVQVTLLAVVEAVAMVVEALIPPTVVEVVTAAALAIRAVRARQD